MKLLRLGLVLLVVASVPPARGQLHEGAPAAQAEHSQQLAAILGLEAQLQRLRVLRGEGSRRSAAVTEEMMVRQELLESLQAAALDVDGVLGEIANERAQLGELRYSLQSRRDRTVNRLNAAALLTGAGLGVAVSATQFTGFSSRTQNIGDGIGIGSGVASTVFSLLAVGKQAGPRGSVGETPNMLAPLLGSPADAELSSYYPDCVLRYLQTIPAHSGPGGRTRLEQLLQQWESAGRLDSADPARREKKIAILSTSMDSRVRVSIDDLTDRIAMLTDVMGRVSLMKRDLAALRRASLEVR